MLDEISLQLKFEEEDQWRKCNCFTATLLNFDITVDIDGYTIITN